MPEINMIKQIVANCRFATHGKATEKVAKEYCTNYLKAMQTNSTAIAVESFEKFGKMNLIYDLFRNPEAKKIFKRDKDLINLRNSVSKVFENSYPKTAELRAILIENSRISLNKVTPKLTGLKKAILRMNSFMSNPDIIL